MARRYLVNFELQRLKRQVADFLVIGSGVAGLFAALKASQHGRVLLLTKDLLEGNTRYAQGGIAAAIGPDDSWQEHLADTLQAGAGLCETKAVSILVQEGSLRIDELVSLGANFDKSAGEISLTREGGHSRRRVLHAGGDATGKEIMATLSGAVLKDSNITVITPAFAVDLLTEGSQCFGALALMPDGRLEAFLSKATIIATGGAGQVYSHTTNSAVVTGDGIAMAYRAGVSVMDMEFFQFHPTGLKVAGAPRALITEAVRGEGAYLLGPDGERFMVGKHPLAELAPRDIVARGIVEAMDARGVDHVWLDLRHLRHLDLPKRFPTVFNNCKHYGLDIREDLIPVSPVAHYFMGGVRVNHQGRTDLDGLYACGEAASLGLHGANRLASNSLLDGLVFGHRIAQCAARNRLHISDQELQSLDLSSCRLGEPTESTFCERGRLQQVMWREVGLTRSRESLMRAQKELDVLSQMTGGLVRTVTQLENVNLLTVAQLITRAALLRSESRGGHYRVDYPERDDRNWRCHLVLQGESTQLQEVEEEVD